MIVALLVLLALLGACRTAPVMQPGPLRPAAVAPSGRDTTCELVPGPVQPAGTLSVALRGPVDPAHAPDPVNESERIAFAQLYEPLIRIDCAGRIVPALAQSWIADSGGKRWTFLLRDDARYWDGAPVTAQDVVAGWQGRDSPVVKGALAASAREVRVVLPEGVAVAALATPELAVTKRAPDLGWPIGTGLYWASGKGATGSLVAQPAGGGRLPVLSFRDLSAVDPRDALDQGTDILVTDDPTIASYAAARPQWVVSPLTWDRRYVLVAPPTAMSEAVAREDLARAVHAEARVADVGKPCAPADIGAAVAPRTILLPRRISFDRSDRTAREIVERLVARGSLGAGVAAAGLAPADFLAAVRQQQLWAYVTMVRPPAAGCYGVPLIETRSSAVLRRGIPRLALDADGTIRVIPR